MAINYDNTDGGEAQKKIPKLVECPFCGESLGTGPGMVRTAHLQRCDAAPTDRRDPEADK